MSKQVLEKEAKQTENVIIPAERRSVRIYGQINTTPVNLDSIEALTPETDKNVTGTFVNVECPGQPAKICGKYYKRMKYFQKVFEDNEKCTIPLSVARYINERIMYRPHKHIMDEKGNPLKTEDQRARYKFVIEQVHN